MKLKILAAVLIFVSSIVATQPKVDAQSAQASKLVIESISPGLAGRGQTVEIVIAYDGDTPVSRPSVRVNDVFRPRDSLDAQVSSLGLNRWSARIASGEKTTIFNLFVTAQISQGEAVSVGLEPIDEKPSNRRDGIIDGFFSSDGSISQDAVFFESDVSLPPPFVNPRDGNLHAFSNPFPIIVDFGVRAAGEPVNEVREYDGDSHDNVTLIRATLDGANVLPTATTADGHRWRLLIPNIESGEHTFVVNARDEAGNTLAEDIRVTFRMLPRPAFPVNLVPGWNLISFPRELADTSIDSVFRPDFPITTVFEFDPTVAGGWRGAFREFVADPLIFGPFVGDLKTIDAARGYWVFSLENIRIGVFLSGLSGGPFGGSPTTPPAINIYEGWNLVPVLDINGNLGPGDVIDSDFYFASLDAEISRILTFDTLTSEWINVVRDNRFETGTQEQLTNAGTPGACPTCPLGPNERVEIGKGYWVFANEAGTLIP